MLIGQNFENTFLLAVDASAYGAGAVLLQVDSNGIEHPVDFFSKKLNRHQESESYHGKRGLSPCFSRSTF